MKTARATAHANIALVKYWGKRWPGQADLNLPEVGSLSLTLDHYRSETRVAPAEADTFVLDENPGSELEQRRVFQHLDRIWAATGRSGKRPPVDVHSNNHLPTAAGLASSASGFAALTLAGAMAFDLGWDRARLSALARRASGSAARSLWGGWVRLDRGKAPDGSDCQARPIFPQDHLDVLLLVVRTASGKKPLGSTEAMEHTRKTSPYYPAWVETHERDLDAACRVLERRDLDALGPVVEHSAFKMHACIMASDPALLYWNGVTLEVIRAVWQARAAGLVGFVTSDAGPHVKVLCASASAHALATRLRDVPGVIETLTLAPGPDATAEVVG